MIVDNSPAVVWTKWLSTVGALGCASFSAFDIYPINVWLGFLAGIGWCWVGWRWREWSLIAINSGLTAIYLLGVVRSFL